MRKPGSSLFLLSLFLLSYTFAAAQIDSSKFNRQRTYDVQHYKIAVRFDRAKRIVYGDAVITLKPLTAGFRAAEFDAAGLAFESVKLENFGRELKYKTGTEKVSVEFDKSYGPDDLLSVRFVYSCRPKKGVYFVAEKKDRGKTVHSEQIWTQGEPDEARHWFPSYDFPDDKATSELLITAQTDETVISNGELLEKRDNGDGTAVFHFKMPVPHSTYLTSFVIGKYSKTIDSYKNIPLGYYVYPGDEALVPLAFSDTKEMFRIFEEATGVPYPFNKYDQTIVDEFQFGGMENVTATTYSDQEIFLARFPHLRGYTIDLVSHELAHSWFGNLVTCRNWAELWLNEGFATYLEAVYRGKMYGESAYAAKIREDANLYLTTDAVNNLRHGLFNQTADQLDKLFRYPSITYNKGSVVVHLLRETVGEETFWQAVNVYLNRHKFGNVGTTDLRKAFEEVSEKNLEQFFRQWVYGVGHPKLAVEPIYSKGEKTLKLSVGQTQKGASVADVFHFPLEVFIQTANGEKMEKVFIDKKNQSFTVPLDAPPSNISLDKNGKLLLFEAKIGKVRVVN